MGPRASLDRCGNSHPPPGFHLQAVQPVASRCTGFVTRPTHFVVVEGLRDDTDGKVLSVFTGWNCLKCGSLMVCVGHNEQPSNVINVSRFLTSCQSDYGVILCNMKPWFLSHSDMAS